MPLWSFLDPNFEFDENNTAAKDTVEKTLALPVVGRLWPNCLHRPIRNAGLVDVEDFTNRLNKVIVKHEGGVSEKVNQKALQVEPEVNRTLHHLPNLPSMFKACRLVLKKAPKTRRTSK